jgi:hypothetical protein
MLTREKILHWEIEFDKELTAQAYRALSAYQCECVYCRNFRLAFGELSPTLIEFLQRFGIDPSQPAESAHYNPNEDGTHLYGWWYHFVGRIVHGEESSADLLDQIQVEFRDRQDLAPRNFPRPIVQLEVFANLPWVLSEDK